MWVHKPGHATVIVLTAIVLIANITINMLAQFGGIQLGIFNYTTGSVPYGSSISPIAETFSIWGFIYLYQLLWVAYGLSTLCRPGPGGQGNLYHNPPYMHIAIYPVFILNLACSITWIFLWDRLRADIALAFIALLPFTLYICIFLAMRGLHKHGYLLYKAGLGLEVKLVRGIVLNGLGIYATWTTIATLLNFATVLEVYAGMDRDTAGTIGLAILAAEIAIWIILDNFVLEKHLRYLLTPYLVVAAAVGGSFAKHFSPWTTNTIITVVLLACSLAMLIIKFILMMVRHFKCKDPLLEETAALSDYALSDRSKYVSDENFSP